MGGFEVAVLCHQGLPPVFVSAAGLSGVPSCRWNVGTVTMTAASIPSCR